MDNDQAGDQFCEEDIEHILRQRTQVIQIAGGVKGSTFSKASFNLTNNRSDINIDDPNFWQKWAKKADIDVSGKKVYDCLQFVMFTYVKFDLLKDSVETKLTGIYDVI